MFILAFCSTISSILLLFILLLSIMLLSFIIVINHFLLSLCYCALSLPSYIPLIHAFLSSMTKFNAHFTSILFSLLPLYFLFYQTKAYICYFYYHLRPRQQLHLIHNLQIIPIIPIPSFFHLINALVSIIVLHIITFSASINSFYLQLLLPPSIPF